MLWDLKFLEKHQLYYFPVSVILNEALGKFSKAYVPKWGYSLTNNIVLLLVNESSAE